MTSMNNNGKQGMKLLVKKVGKGGMGKLRAQRAGRARTVLGKHQWFRAGLRRWK